MSKYQAITAIRAVFRSGLDLSPTERAALVSMLLAPGRAGVLWISAETVARESGASVSTVTRLRRRLEAAGVLVPTKRPERARIPARARVYRVRVAALSELAGDGSDDESADEPEPVTVTGRTGHREQFKPVTVSNDPPIDPPMDPPSSYVPSAFGGPAPSLRIVECDPMSSRKPLRVPGQLPLLGVVKTTDAHVAAEPAPRSVPVGVEIAADRVIDAWLAEWAARRAAGGGKRPPGMPRGTDPRKAPGRDAVVSALRSGTCTLDDAILVVRWAFRSPDNHARFLRGEARGSGTLYLGLASLFRRGPFGGKLEHAHAWHDEGEALDEVVAGSYVAAGGDPEVRVTDADLDEYEALRRRLGGAA